MIVTIDYYYGLGFAGKGDARELGRALSRAERLIDIVSFGKCRELEALHEAAQERLKYAICVQAEYFITYGYDDANEKIDHKVKIGDFSYESKSNGVQNNLAPEAQGVLKLAGLLYTGAEVKS
jgi:hypothetical protein